MIYFIQAGNNGPIKIGTTSNGIDARLCQLQTGCPYELKVLWCYHGDGFTETEIHEKFKEESLRGEWFHPSKKITDFINENLDNDNFFQLDNHKTKLDIHEFMDGYEIETDDFVATIHNNGMASFFCVKIDIYIDTNKREILNISKQGKTIYEKNIEKNDG